MEFAAHLIKRFLHLQICKLSLVIRYKKNRKKNIQFIITRSRFRQEIVINNKKNLGSSFWLKSFVFFIFNLILNELMF